MRFARHPPSSGEEIGLNRPALTEPGSTDLGILDPAASQVV
ncbi:hypothetical protein [Lentzea sp. NPDC051838]